MLFTVFGAAFGMQLYVTATPGGCMGAEGADKGQQGLRHRIREDLEQPEPRGTSQDGFWKSHALTQMQRQWKDIKQRYMEAAEDDE
jgi:hypothetical protein